MLCVAPLKLINGLLGGGARGGARGRETRALPPCRKAGGRDGANRKRMQEHNRAWVPILEKDPWLGQKPALWGQQWEVQREQREPRLASELDT